MTPELREKLDFLLGATYQEGGLWKQMERPFQDQCPIIDRERLKSFIDTHYIARSEVEKMIEEMPVTIHTPVGGFSNIEWVKKLDLLSTLKKRI
jgi:hypothetical protein